MPTINPFIDNRPIPKIGVNVKVKIKTDSAEDNNHVCDYGCGAVLEDCVDNTKDHDCDICGKEGITKHEYGNASCDVAATCIICGAVSGEAVGHNYGSWVYVEGTGTHQRICANDPTHIETENCTGNIEYTGATCTQSGIRVVGCKVCGGEERMEYPALGHQFIDDEDYTITVEATCTQNGSVKLKCVRCDETKDIGVLPSKGHRYFTVTDALAPTCTTPGHGIVERCLTCSYEKPADIIPATGHSLDEDGQCVTCGVKEYEGNKYCSCMCHNTSGLMKFIYKIVRFFWSIFKINKSCDCGTVHY